MAQTCDGCGERAAWTRYWAEGVWAGRTLCRDCASRRKKMTRLASLVAFKWRLAQVLPRDDKATAPTLRLMMAVDDVRRAQIQLIEASERLDGAGVARYLALSDWLYAMRLLFTHIHEARHALTNLDTHAPQRADSLLTDHPHEWPPVDRREARRALTALRKFFCSADYKNSFIARVRNTIGAHYDADEIAKLLAEHVSDDDMLESTAASVGGLARMADPLVRGILNIMNGGDFMADEDHVRQVQDALKIAGHLITVVDHLFDALMRDHRGAIVETHEQVVDFPAPVIRAREAVGAARRGSVDAS